MRDYEIHYVWIPCKKRLPEEDGYYVATIKKFARILGRPIDYVSMVYYDGEGWRDHHYKLLKTEYVTAWCPFPTPYLEVTDE